MNKAVLKILQATTNSKVFYFLPTDGYWVLLMDNWFTLLCYKDYLDSVLPLYYLSFTTEFWTLVYASLFIVERNFILKIRTCIARKMLAVDKKRLISEISM